MMKVDRGCILNEPRVSETSSDVPDCKGHELSVSETESYWILLPVPLIQLAAE